MKSWPLLPTTSVWLTRLEKVDLRWFSMVKFEDRSSTFLIFSAYLTLSIFLYFYKVYRNVSLEPFSFSLRER